jgi:uncharacterized LabA/DUF88 family protein
MMRTIAYVDGFNLFYGSLKGTAFRWLDLCAYFDRTLPEGHQLLTVKYFTARVSELPHDRDAPKRQDVYLRALKSHLGDRLQVVEGQFKVKNVRAPLSAPPHRTVDIIKTEEKGSDVNLAVELVNDAWLDRFDCAAVVSNDADLERALRVVKQQRRKRVLLYTPGAPVRRPLGVLNGLIDRSGCLQRTWQPANCRQSSARRRSKNRIPGDSG